MKTPSISNPAERKELEPKPWSGCSTALPSLREAFDDDLVPRALADARGTRPAASATVRRALDSVQHHFAARRVHRRKKLTWHMPYLARSRKASVTFTALEGRSVARASLPPRRAFVMFPTG